MLLIGAIVQIAEIHAVGPIATWHSEVTDGWEGKPGENIMSLWTDKQSNV